MNTRVVRRHCGQTFPSSREIRRRRSGVSGSRISLLAVCPLVLVLSVAFPAAVQSEDFLEKDVDLGNVVLHKNVIFAEYDPATLALNAYVLKSDRPSPVLVQIISGGWHSNPTRIPDGKERVAAQRFEEYFDAGLSVIQVPHRSTKRDDVHWPAPMDDVARAVQFLRYKAAEWNLDGGRISLMGRSSGSHVAEMVAYSPDRGDSQSDDPILRQSTRISCVLAYAGTSDLALHFNMCLKTGPGGKPAVTREYMAEKLKHLFGLGPEAVGTEEMSRRLRTMSPLPLLTKNSPPTLLVHAGPPDAKSKDDPRLEWEVHTPINGFIMAERMNELGIPHELVLVERNDPNRTQREIAFLKKHGGL